MEKVEGLKSNIRRGPSVIKKIRPSKIQSAIRDKEVLKTAK